mmetsp:Transcript_2686/g.6295  ORF Transcript_2686/g.6295 Transcript_2686/m.6295 type:complete len:143 (+) Transcript_2686:203-631(+)
MSVTEETHHDPIGQPYFCTTVLLQLLSSEQPSFMKSEIALRSSSPSAKQAQPLALTCCVLEESCCATTLSLVQLNVLKEDALETDISEHQQIVAKKKRNESRAILLMWASNVWMIKILREIRQSVRTVSQIMCEFLGSHLWK